MEVSEIIKALRFCGGDIEPKPELLHEAADALEKLEKSNSLPLGKWDSPEIVPTKNEYEIIDCIVIVQGVKSGAIRLEETQYRYGEWDISNAWNLLAWYRLTVPENKPLTLDELREMDGNPIWISEKKNESQDARSLWQQFAYEAPKTGIIAFWEFGYEVENDYKISDYGKTWIAYAHQPEEK